MVTFSLQAAQGWRVSVHVGGDRGHSDRGGEVHGRADRPGQGQQPGEDAAQIQDQGPHAQHQPGIKQFKAGLPD